MATTMSESPERDNLHVEFKNDEPDLLDGKHINNASKPPAVAVYAKNKIWKRQEKSGRKNSLKNAVSLTKTDASSRRQSLNESRDSLPSAKMDERLGNDPKQSRRKSVVSLSPWGGKKGLTMETIASLKTRRRWTSDSEDNANMYRRQSTCSGHGTLNTSLLSTPRSSVAGYDSVFESVLASERSIHKWSSRVKPGIGEKGSGRDASRRKVSKHTESESEPKFPAIQTFRRVARLVRLLCSVCIALRSYAIGKGLMDDYLVSISHRANLNKCASDADDLTFNLENFKIKKELEVPESTKVILGKLPDHRTPSDIEAILRLMRELPSFRKYTREMQQLFCRIVRYMRCSQNRVVLRKGHIGYNLYFIFTGTCSVVLDKDEKSVFVKKEVIILRKGACFGEIALVQNTRRNATVVCTQDTEFLVVDKDLFLEKGLNHQMEEEFKFRFNIFRGLKIISHWDDNKVRELSNVSRMEEFGYNRIIVKDSKLNDWLWFVVKGSCDIVRLVDLERCQSYKKLINDPSPESRASLETLAAASRGAFFWAESGPAQSESAMSFSPDSNSKPGGSEAKFFKKWRQKDKPVEKKKEAQSTGTSEVDISRIDDMLHNLRNNQVSEVLLKLKEKATEAKNKEKEKEKEEEILESLQEPGSGLFFKVDTLRDSQCFGMETIIPKKKPIIQGLENLDDDYNPPRTFTLVSRGCEVIHVPKTRFTEIADKETIANITKACKVYPEDDELCQRFIERCNWDAYKREVIEEVVVNKERNKGFEAGLRSGKLKGQDIALAKKTGDGEKCSPYITSPPSPPPGPHPQQSLLQRPHTAFARRIKGAESKNSIMKSSWEMNLDRMKSTSGLRNRPSTCPPRVSKQKLLKMRLGHGASNSDRISGKPGKLGGAGGENVSNLRSSKGYQVDGTNVYVRGSQRTLQIISGVRSPSHEYRLNKLGRK